MQRRSKHRQQQCDGPDDDGSSQEDPERQLSALDDAKESMQGDGEDEHAGGDVADLDEPCLAEASGAGGQHAIGVDPVEANEEGE